MIVGKKKLDIVGGLRKLLLLFLLGLAVAVVAVLLNVSSSFAMQLCFQSPVSLIYFILLDIGYF